MQPKRAIVHLTWCTTVLVPVDEDFSPDYSVVGDGLTPEQIEEAWRLGMEDPEFPIKRGRSLATGWTKQERYIPD